MAANFRAVSTAGDGQSATTSSLTITVPTSGAGGTVAAGDLATIVVLAGTTSASLTTPTGWTQKSGPIVYGGTSVWRYQKDSLVSGDLGASVTLAFSTAVRCQAIMLVASGVDPSQSSGYSNGEGSSTGSPTFYSLTSGVPSGAVLFGVFSRRYSGTPAATLHMPSSLSEIGSAKTAFGSSGELSTLGGWQITTAGSFSASGASSPATTGTNYLVLLPAAATGGTAGSVTLATAQGTGTANPLTINGTTTVVGGSEWPPAPYRQSIRSGGIILTYIVSASLGGVPVSGAQDLRPVGGDITDTTTPGVRRVLNLDLAPEPGLYDLLSPEGTTLTVICRVRYQDRTTYDIPMGVFDVDTQSLSEGGGKISLTAPDLWVRIQRSRFLVPQASYAGLPVVQQITQLIQGAIPGAGVQVTATSRATTPVLVWDRDRDKAITDLATDIGAWVYFDRQGGAVIADIPQLGASADWLIDASPTGVLVSLDRQRARTDTRNVVVVTSSASAGPAFSPQIVWDNDSQSPTYAGTNPLTNPGSAGPFGIVPAFYASPVLSSESEAYQAGVSILSRTVGLATQVSLSQVPNPALDAFQTIDVLRPKRPFEASPATERYVADTVTHPLLMDGNSVQHIDARSTRTSAYASGLS